MITLKTETAELIKKEMESIPEKYHKPFNSLHEGLGVLREEYMELEQEIFFGEKKVKEEFVEFPERFGNMKSNADWKYKQKVKQEAVQVAAMAARIIQELT
jgi:hypothetical protein